MDLSLSRFRALALLIPLVLTPSTDEPDQGDSRATAPRIVLYVLFDTLGADHVSHLGYDRETTPNLDALAKLGVAFENAFTPAPYALASIPSLMTGRYPDRHGMVSTKTKLSAEETTLAERLSAEGYRTVGLSSVYNGGPNYGNDQGFDRFVEMYLGPGPEGARQIQFKGQTCHFPSPPEYMEALRSELDRLGDDQRLYLFVHFLQPHEPYDPPPEFLNRFRDQRFPGPYDPADRAKLNSDAMGHAPSPEQIEALAHLYDSNVAFADAGLGQILRELHGRGVFDEALIVATGDHGEAFWQHGMHGHGVELYDELMRVPAVLKLPAGDGHKGLRRKQLVSILDFVPTVLERVGSDDPHRKLDGRSLLSLLETPEPTIHHERLFMRSEPKPGVPRRIGMRWPGEKVIVTLPEEPGATLELDQVLLFDLSQDPGEQRDLSSREPERALRAAREAMTYYAGLQASGEEQD